MFRNEAKRAGRFVSSLLSSLLTPRFSTLSLWVDHPPATAQIFNSILPFLPQGFKAVKGRLALLRWLNQYKDCIEAKQASCLVRSVMDCLTDRVSTVRIEATKTVEVLARLCPPDDFERAMKDRPSPDVQTLRATLDAFLGTRAHQSAAPAAETPPAGKLSELEQRKKSLALRPGVRLLSKPKAGEGLKARYSNAKSSIPKPMPRFSAHRRSVESSFLNPPSERSSILSLSNASIFLSYPVVPRGWVDRSTNRSWRGRKRTGSGT